MQTRKKRGVAWIEKDYGREEKKYEEMERELLLWLLVLGIGVTSPSIAPFPSVK